MSRTHFKTYRLDLRDAYQSYQPPDLRYFQFQAMNDTEAELEVGARGRYALEVRIFGGWKRLHQRPESISIEA